MVGQGSVIPDEVGNGVELVGVEEDEDDDGVNDDEVPKHLVDRPPKAKGHLESGGRRGGNEEKNRFFFPIRNRANSPKDKRADQEKTTIRLR